MAEQEIYFQPTESATDAGNPDPCCVPGTNYSIPLSLLTDEKSESTLTVSQKGEDDSYHTVTINGSSLHEIMKKGAQVSVLPILLGFIGWKEGRKVVALEKLLSPESALAIRHDFTSHQILATARQHLGVVVSDSALYNYAFQSCREVSSSRRDIVYKVDDVRRFPSSNLNQHISDLLTHLQENTLKCVPETYKTIISNIRRGLAMIKVWNISFSTNVLYFLRSFSGHLTNSRLWLFTDLEGTLHCSARSFSLSEDDAFRPWYSKLDYLLRSMRLCNGSTGERRKRKPCRVFASYKENVDQRDAEEEVQKLEKEMLRIATQLNVTQLAKKRISPFGMANGQVPSFQKRLCGLLKSDDEQPIPLTWLFLRGSLENQKNMFMTRSELSKLAMECGIVESDEFCKFFTSFGSLFDISLVCPQSDTIIIKPDVFLSKLSQTFDDSTRSDEYTKDGIITREVAIDILGPEGVQLMTVLSQVGMVSIIPRGKFGDGSNEECYYMPCARKVKQKRTLNEGTVRLLLNIHRPSNTINFEVAFTNFLLKTSDRAQLQPSGHENMSIFKYIEDSEEYTQIAIVYKGDVIEMKVEATSNVNSTGKLKAHKYIIQTMQGVAESQKKNGQFTFAFAVICSEDGQYHMLPEDLCEKCKDNKYFQIWKEALEQEPIQDEFKLTTAIKPEDVMFLAKEMELYSAERLKQFAKEFNGNMDDAYLSFPLQFVFTIIINWMNSSTSSVTKVDLARKLSTLGLKYGDKNFKMLARKLYHKVIEEKNTVYQSQESSGTLQINHLEEVERRLVESGFRLDLWYELGKELGLSQRTLDNINHRCLNGCLVKWLESADERGEVTLTTLANALEKIGQSAAAASIRTADFY